MDIDLLSKIIRELIGRHDSVGLPGLGTFVAEEMPATFSDRGYTINPPYRRLSFHPSRTEDTLLVDFYAESNNLSREMANAYIVEFLSELKQVLIQRKTVAFPGLGRLRATRENNFFFVPNEDLDIYEEGFALRPVSLKNLQAVEEKLVIPVSFEQALRGLRRAETGTEAAQTEVKPVLTGETSMAPAEPVAEPVAEPEAVRADAPAVPCRTRLRKWGIAVLVVVSVLAAALGTFVVLAHAAPDFIDSLLYTKEELEILNY